MKHLISEWLSRSFVFGGLRPSPVALARAPVWWFLMACLDGDFTGHGQKRSVLMKFKPAQAGARPPPPAKEQADRREPVWHPRPKDAAVVDDVPAPARGWRPGPGQEICIEPRLLAGLLRGEKSVAPTDGEQAMLSRWEAATDASTAVTESSPSDWLLSLLLNAGRTQAVDTAPQAELETESRRWMPAGHGSG